ncbi:MAG: hypothetical protein DRO11_03370 [Methanobacteriota archaeon]|nr:MAG: hypothetical protein DRO11_03370 [Euryarchaeota archaeon]
MEKIKRWLAAIIAIHILTLQALSPVIPAKAEETPGEEAPEIPGEEPAPPEEEEEVAIGPAMVAITNIEIRIDAILENTSDEVKTVGVRYFKLVKKEEKRLRSTQEVDENIADLVNYWLEPKKTLPEAKNVNNQTAWYLLPHEIKYITFTGLQETFFTPTATYFNYLSSVETEIRSVLGPNLLMFTQYQEIDPKQLMVLDPDILVHKWKLNVKFTVQNLSEGSINVVVPAPYVLKNSALIYSKPRVTYEFRQWVEEKRKKEHEKRREVLGVDVPDWDQWLVEEYRAGGVVFEPVSLVEFKESPRIKPREEDTRPVPHPTVIPAWRIWLGEPSYEYYQETPEQLPTKDNDNDGGDDDNDGGDEDGDGKFNEDPPELPIDNDNDGLIDEDPEEPQVDNDGDGSYSEDPIDGFDNDNDGLTDEDPEEPQVDNDGDGKINEDPSEQVDNDNDGLLNEDGGGINEDQINGIDDDLDGLVDEDWGGVDEDPIDGVDNDGDGLVDEDPPELGGFPGLRTRKGSTAKRYYDALEAKLDELILEFKRLAELYNSGLISRKAYEDAREDLTRRMGNVQLRMCSLRHLRNQNMATIEYTYLWDPRGKVHGLMEHRFGPYKNPLTEIPNWDEWLD